MGATNMEVATTWQEEPWMILAQPAHGGAANPRYLQLLAALDEGWVVSPPVYRRPRWLDDTELVYHFILKHPRRPDVPRLITVPDDNALRAFVAERRIALQ